MSQPRELEEADEELEEADEELEKADEELRKLGYHYNDNDELRSVDGEKEFVFVNQVRRKRVAGGSLHWRGASGLACVLLLRLP